MTPAQKKPATSTFIVKTAFCAFLSSFFLLATAFADPELAKADKALSQKNIREADFWVTRVLSREPSSDIKTYLAKRALPPVLLLSPEFDSGFTAWFMEASRSLWRVPENKIKKDLKRYELKMTTSGRYFAAISAAPRLEQWSVSKPGSTVHILSTGDPAAKVTILSNYPTLYLEMGKHALQYVWEPQFYDIDADGTPELFVRYNLTWGNGYRQYLIVYKIKNDMKLEYFTKFEGRYEGMARLLPNGLVEVASGAASKASLSQMHFDQWKIETWKFNGKAYEKSSERTIPHPLKGKEWQNFI